MNQEITCYFDGCCEPVNPGGTASYGAVIFIDNNRIWESSKIFHPQKGKEKETSNNVAEYSGFIAILDYLLENDLTKGVVKIYGDSKLVIEQMSGRWRIKQGFYVPLALEAQKKLVQFKNWPFLQWIPREQNNIADELSKCVLLKAGVRFRIQPQ